jgi:hypothetical protein
MAALPTLITGVAAAGIARFASDAPTDPGIWDLLKRLFDAAISVASSMPVGQPFNAVEFLLKVFGVAGQEQLGDNISKTLTVILNAPDIGFTVWGYIVYIATIGIALPIAVYNGFRYWKRYQEYRKIAGGNSEAELLDGRNASLVSPFNAVMRSIIVLAILVGGAVVQQALFNWTFQLIKGLVEGFYTGSNTTIGGAIAQLMLSFAQTAGAVDAVLLLMGVLAAVTFIVIVMLNRLVRFVLATIEVFIILAHVTAGRREITFGTAAAFYFRRLVFLALTILIALLGPIAIQHMNGLTGNWALIAVIITCWLAYELPRAVFKLLEQFADEDLAKDYMANREAASAAAINKIKLILTLVGTGALAGTTLAFPELAPVIATAGAVAGSVRHVASTGDVRHLTSTVQQHGPNAAAGLRTFSARFSRDGQTAGATADQPQPVPTPTAAQPGDAASNQTSTSGGTAAGEVVMPVDVGPTPEIAPSETTEEAILWQALPIWARERDMTDAVRGYMAALYLHEPPIGDSDEVIQFANDRLKDMSAEERLMWAMKGARIRNYESKQRST